MADRGREAKIRPQYQGLYPGLQAADWKPVEAILQHLAELSPEDRAKVGVDDGSRFLRDDHFEFRGSSARPEGISSQLTRVTDPGADSRRASLQGELDAEQDQLTMRQREAEQTIAQAEHLRDRADALHQDFERLRQRAAELDLRQQQGRQEDESEKGPESGNT
jgi:hypothetical protein